ncbi:MAG: hypothetical protein Q8P30_01320 [Candidatus Uhrbacteria bacterium]|nr:hypothetical protein [Candidatus Uhrbacteria bacterium]
MISIFGQSPKNISKQYFRVYLQKTLHEALDILGWKSKDINVKIIIIINKKISLGSGRACHGRTIRKIMLNPRPHHPFPWNTVRHELIHILLKSRIKLSLPPTARPILMGLNYIQQSTRDNVEEYIVRILNNLFLSKKNGSDWYKAQLLHEKRSGFRRIRTVARQIESWQLSKKPFSTEIFKRIAKILIC